MAEERKITPVGQPPQSLPQAGRTDAEEVWEQAVSERKKAEESSDSADLIS